MAEPWDIVDDKPEPPPEERTDDGLGALRIRAIVNERRAAYRRLLWARAVAFLFGCAAIMTGLDVLRVSGSERLWFAIASSLLVLLTVRACLRLRRFALKSPAMDLSRPDPAALSRLSDGSQFLRGLDNLTHRQE